MTSYHLVSKDYSYNMKVRWSKMIIKRGFLSEMDSHNLITTFPQTQDFACPHANEF